MLLVSGYSKHSVSAELLNRPNVKFLSKPFTSQQLKEAIQSLAGGLEIAAKQPAGRPN